MSDIESNADKTRREVKALKFFLEEKMTRGNTWHTRFVDDLEYGRAGEEIDIQQAFPPQRPVTHFESPQLSAEVASNLADKLASYGFTNPKDFTKVQQVGGREEPQTKFVVLFTLAGARKAMEHEVLNADILRSRQPLIPDTGIIQKS